ncbi:MAG: TetR/AcrR family transcriptional regulator [Myxococcales bacterium]|nr:TetR/AcrR family transcriptional regulator [Myxococcales bacterium]MCB9626235.1 TetR/AcrR family transcriptional regulator [Sandaracinaceae bacterium]
MSASFPTMNAAETRKTERRDEILAAALRVFAEKGYHDAGIADIAGVLGMGHGTFYRYFKNKHDIALAVLDHVVMRFAAIGLLEDPAGTDTVEAYRQQVERMLTRMVDLGDSEPDLVRFFQMQGFVVDAERLGRAMDAFALYAALFLENGVKKGFLRADLDVVLTSQGLIALMFEGARRALVEPDPATRRRWVNAGMRLMFDGIVR